MDTSLDEVIVNHSILNLKAGPMDVDKQNAQSGTHVSGKP